MSTPAEDTAAGAVPEALAPYLRPAASVDSDHPEVVAFALQHAAGVHDPREQAVALYLAVRDGFRYDPYAVDQRPPGFRASTVLERGYGYCLPKSALLAAAARVVGIPSRVGFATVRNHLTSPKLLELMGTDLFVYHGYTELWLDGRWVKATPAFNRSLCERTGTVPLQFDGRHDSLMQPLDRAGRRHMEYVEDHGVYADVPIQQVLDAWHAVYPHLRDARPPAEQDGAERFERDAITPPA